tara:strand:+ start:617 stop:835 length:219 start_codon:yes stop_codon:yes gene_type:complete
MSFGDPNICPQQMREIWESVEPIEAAKSRCLILFAFSQLFSSMSFSFPEIQLTLSPKWWMSMQKITKTVKSV